MPMPIPFAYILAEETGAADPVLLAVAEALQARGLRLAGTVALPPAAPDTGHPCETELLVLPDGPRLCISQQLGRQSRGCRLDPSALEEAVMAVSARADQPAHAFLLNKFGKQEAEGRGFRDLIASSLGDGIPVVVGVNGLNLPGLQAFAAGEAIRLPCEVAAVVGWIEQHLVAA
jgi:hypothetical protein